LPEYPVCPIRNEASPLPSSALEASFVDIQSAAVWPGVHEDQVLLLPHEVRTSWREFMSNSNVVVQQVMDGGREGVTCVWYHNYLPCSDARYEGVAPLPCLALTCDGCLLDPRIHGRLN